MNVTKVTDNEIRMAFGDNFKSYPLKEKKKLIADCILKLYCGYRDSVILAQIITEMKLISKKGTILKRGKYYLFNYYYG